MKKRWIALIVFVALLMVVKVVLLGAREVPERARFAIDLNALRQAAGPLESCPESASAEQVASMQAPQFGVMAGGAFSMVTFGFYSWQLRYADGSTAFIDPVHSRATHEKNSKGEPYDEAAWERQEKAIATASTIVVTHEHYDHLGGVADSSHFASFGSKLKLTAAQRRPLPLAGVSRDLSGEPTLESGPEGSLHLVAPGIVALTAAGHTPGSQLIYVRLHSGRELLFIGDVAWQELNLERLATRARLVSLVMGEDAEAITHQIRAVVELRKANPSLDVIVAHDVAAMERRFQAGTVGRSFQLPASPPIPAEDRADPKTQE